MDTRTDAVGRAFAGSQRQIQTYVNEKPSDLSLAIAGAFSGKLEVPEIEWVSPLASDLYTEYRDADFLKVTGLEHLTPALRSFWPRGGPCWDALARIPNGCVLIEAKSHIPEIYGGGCGASEKSRQQITTALSATKAWLAVPDSAEWTGRLYQSANRFATLYFLREIARVRAFLVNVYFIQDPRTPTTRQQWEVALEQVNVELGIRSPVPSTTSIFLTV